jgi:Predicted NAD/FAD-binding protein
MGKKRLAVIGSGISGLSAAFFLSKKYNVSLFEKNNTLGGHTRTVSIFEQKKKILVDTGFIVFNEKNYQDFISFLNYLNVNSENSKMSFSVSDIKNKIEYGGSSINSLFAQRKNILSLKFIFFIFEILKLYRICKKLYLKIDLIENISIEEFFNTNNFSKFIRDYHIYPNDIVYLAF